MSDEIGAQWRNWAMANGVAPSYLEAVVAAAIAVGQAGAGTAACAAAGRIAGGLGSNDDRSRLQRELTFVEGMLAELGEPERYPEVDPAALAAIAQRLGRRAQALQLAATYVFVPLAPAHTPAAAVAATAPVAPVPAVAAVPASPRPPLGPSLRQFASEHSILLLSYAGAFLLIVAVVLFELYGVASLGASVRFGGVLGLDLVFAAAGWACLRSRRLKLVGHTYVAIAAVQAPLVFVAAYVFFALQQKGISIDLALLVTGAACSLLYAALAIRLRSHAYGLLALIALPVAWYGGVNLAQLGTWRGPETGVLVAVYTLIAFRSSRVAVAGDLFARYATPFVHGAAVFAVGLTSYDTGWFYPWPAWFVTGMLAIIGGGYLLYRLLGGSREGSILALGLLLLAWTCLLYDVGAGSWRGALTALAGVVPVVIAHRRPRLAGLGERLGGDAAWFYHAAAGLGLLLVLFDTNAAQQWLPWRFAALLAVVAAVYLLAAVLGAGEIAVGVALAASGLAWAAAAHDLALGDWTGTAVAATTCLYALTALPGVRHTRLGGLAVRQVPYHMAGAAAIAIGLVLALGDANRVTGSPAAATMAVLTLGFGGFAVLTDGLVTAITARVAFGAAWILAVHDLGLGPWRGTADTMLVSLYALSGLPRLQLSRIGALLAARRQWLVYSSSAIALGLTAYDSVSATGHNWLFPATFAGLAIAYLVFARLGGGLIGAAICLGTAGLAWLAAVIALDLRDWTAVAMAPLALVYLLIGARGASLSATGGLLARAARPYVHLATIAALLMALLLELGNAILQPGGRWITWQAPAVLAIVAATYLGHWAFFRRPLALFAMALAASLAVLAASQVLEQHSTGAAIELVLLAAAWAAGAERARDKQLRLLLRLGVAIQSLLPVVVVAEPSAVAMTVLVAATAVLVGMAWLDRSPRWLLVAGPTLAAAWYWGGAALFPHAPSSQETLAVLFAPFVLGLGLLGIALRVALGRSWALPAYLYGGIALLSVEALFLSIPDLELAGRWLLADVVVLYAIAAIENRFEAAAVAAVGAFVGIDFLLAAAGAAPIWYPVALGALSVAVYAGQLPWERFHKRDSDWIGAHRYLGLGGAAMTALSGFVLFDYTRPHTLGCALAGLAVLVFAGLVATDGRRFKHPEYDYAAAFAAALASYFAARYFAAGNPEWYLAGPGLALVAIGLRAPFDARLKLQPNLPQWAVGIGALLILGVTAEQAVVDSGWTNTVLLVVEGAAALVAGIGFRSRVLVVAGGAAIGVAALKSLFVLAQHYLFFAFGAVALVLLALGAALALLRERFQDARSSFAEQWREWN